MNDLSRVELLKGEQHLNQNLPDERLFEMVLRFESLFDVLVQIEVICVFDDDARMRGLTRECSLQ